MDEKLRREIGALEQAIREQKTKLSKLMHEMPDEEIGDYTFTNHDGARVTLVDLFGPHRELLLVHNMGKSCPYCTLWADGFVGLTKHLQNRAAFVVVSNDAPVVQQEFYATRGWTFTMVSGSSSTFNRDMEFETADGKQMPGVSAFYLDENGKVYRSGYRYFGPGDDFCAVWPMFDLLKHGPNEWAPKFQYED